MARGDTDAGFMVNPGFEKLGGANVLLSAPIRRAYRATHRTDLTLKFTLSGPALYRTRNADYEVTPGRCLLLNRGQTYDLEIGGDTGTRTLAFIRPTISSSARRYEHSPRLNFAAAAAADDDALLLVSSSTVGSGISPSGPSSNECAAEFDVDDVVCELSTAASRGRRVNSSRPDEGLSLYTCKKTRRIWHL